MTGLSGVRLGGREARGEEAAKIARAAPAVMEYDSTRFIRAHMKNGRRICIKYPLGQKAGLKYHLQKIAGLFTARFFLQPLPLLPAQQKNLLEIDRLRAFGAAGLPVPEILAVQNGFSIFADTGKNIEEILAELSGRDTALHDGLLIRCGQAIGQAHAAGLCVGRLNLRNMFLAQSGVGFSGFEDYPEQFMSASVAQARDIWLALPKLCAAAIDRDRVLAEVFAAWRRQAGLATLESLRAGAHSCRLVLKPYKVFAAIFPRRGRTSRLSVLRFLVKNLGI